MNTASAVRSTGTEVGLAGYAKYRARAPVRSRTRPTNDTPTMPGSAPAVLVMPRSAPAYLRHGQPHQAHHLCISSHMTPGKAIRLPVAGDSQHNILGAMGRSSPPRVDVLCDAAHSSHSATLTVAMATCSRQHHVRTACSYAAPMPHLVHAIKTAPCKTAHGKGGCRAQTHVLLCMHAAIAANTACRESAASF